ncbi:hypothetical protein TCAL_07753 [Tigriopus californicus]|uniref:Mpv17-like protein 2 n=1 Tax=Tigriopus californicus TaxID=6832 RepID=A0A553PT96_TIGCA|nr:mpv17-like protein 2 [Tigriopus californicus]TRY80897.1 hypothetical protein TCAL_07753 [Tigriopus californicus]|eukprot:TCALIF_07753-PA protein Name:"Similar to mpv17l2 Mpv17-like protein 2 (Xenopus tropicalis)" AED:0.02 eAED:0.02 QI:67/1/0.66/1/1/1/3/74/187
MFRQVKVLVEKGFSKHLAWTNTITCGFLLGGGDIIEQRIEKYRKKHTPSPHEFNASRTGRMFLVGLSQGPPHHYWYTFLDKYLPKRDLRTVGIKILADQLIAAPFFALTFFYGIGLLEKNTFSGCWTEFVAKFPYIYAFDWFIWPPTQYVNFVWVPPKYRVLYINFITVIWDVFLSYIKHVEEIEEN